MDEFDQCIDELMDGDESYYWYDEESYWYDDEESYWDTESYWYDEESYWSSDSDWTVWCENNSDESDWDEICGSGYSGDLI